MICLAGIMCLLLTSSVPKWTIGHAPNLEPLRSYPPRFVFSLFWELRYQHINLVPVYCCRPLASVHRAWYAPHIYGRCVVVSLRNYLFGNAYYDFTYQLKLLGDYPNKLQTISEIFLYSITTGELKFPNDCRFFHVKRKKIYFPNNKPSDIFSLPCRVSPEGYSCRSTVKGIRFWFSWRFFICSWR